MEKSAAMFLTVTAILGGPALWGQRSASAAAGAVVKPVTTAPSTDNITGTEKMIENRSVVLKDKADGSGTRYFYVKDSDLAGKTQAEIVQRLTPIAVTPQQKVKTMDVVVDVERPLFVTTEGKQPFTIGTTIVEGNVKDLRVNSDIKLGEVKITKK